jgi:transcriptional regulator with XRE-family HTH domain
MQQNSEIVTTGQAFGRRVKQLRNQRGFRSAVALAKAVSAHGVRVNRAAVTNIENEHRESLTVDEVYAFALALNTSPANLLTGVDGVSYRVGDVEMTGRQLREWWRGNMPLPASEEETLDFYLAADAEALEDFLARYSPGAEAAQMVNGLLRRLWVRQHRQPFGPQQPGSADDDSTALRADIEKWFARLRRAVKTALDELDA